MGVRKPKQFGGGRNIIGIFHSLKAGQGVPFESRVEYLVMYILDWLFWIASFQSQPIKYEYHWKGRKRSYVPDLLVNQHQVENPFYIEAKAEALLDRDKFEFLQQEFKDQGNKLFLITDTMLEQGYFTDNVVRISKFARHDIQRAVVESYHEILSNQGGSLPIMDLAERIFPDKPNRALISILSLIFHHKLNVEMNSALISDSSVVWLPQNTNFDIKEISDVSQLFTPNPF